MRTGIDDLIQIQDRYYILASSSRIDDRTRVLKHDDLFAVLDRFGELAPQGFGELGFYYDGTRFLSRLGVPLGRHRPLLLSSTLSRDNTRLLVDLTNPDLPAEDGAVIPRGTIHLCREVLLWNGVAYDQLRLVNHGRAPVSVDLSIHLDADFADIFEVRGTHRERSGRRAPVVCSPTGMEFAYEGLDDRRRVMRVVFSEAPATQSGSESVFSLPLAPHEPWTLVTTYSCEISDRAALRPLSFPDALERRHGDLASSLARDSTIVTSNSAFNDWLERSIADLHMMVTRTAQGPYPYAGVPWFSTPFGRDGIWTALMTLWVSPEIARGVLGFLAAHQATEHDPARDAQPGKILHEARGGEMAALGEVPFGRYYGSVDATPLFVMLAGAYLERTGDLAFAREIWPHVQRAIEWIEGDGDPDGDGFVEYARRSPDGLVQQGWKDSFDSVFHANGELAEPPIALCEVQGYVVAALEAAASMAERIGMNGDPSRLRRRAELVRRRFEECFWVDDISTYAIALDGAKRPCRIRASNAGHALYTGIAGESRAALVMQGLLAEDSFSGWGVRTLSLKEVRYNPMSYHNGSVWPHDNAVIAAGFARYGFHEAAARVLSALFEASLHFDLRRTPELYCGFGRTRDAGPTLYPVACAPQSWAAAAPFLLLKACLGLRIDASRGLLTLVRPTLPEFLEEVHLKNVRVGDSCVSLRLDRNGPKVDVSVVERRGELEVAIR